MATTSQKMILQPTLISLFTKRQVSRRGEEETHEMRFFVLILGARTPPPKMDEPVMKMPLQAPPNRTTVLPSVTPSSWRGVGKGTRYHPAPRTERPMHKPTPISAQK